jgi:hypothetical protein
MGEVLSEDAVRRGIDKIEEQVLPYRTTEDDPLHSVAKR